jgi:3-oxoacyl-[acyl-carrier protein] reductase
MEWQGKTALITGASRGIGRAIALELARLGVSRLILVARNHEQLQEVAKEVAAQGGEGMVIALDLTDTLAVSRILNLAWRDHGPVDILVNCAGIAHQAPFLQTKLAQVQAEISLNLLGTITVTRFLAAKMAARQTGIIVNVASLMGKVAAPTMSTYSATKFALLGFTQALRGELAPYNVRVVALLPSLTQTEMIEDLHLFRGVKAVTPEIVARALITGLQRHSTEIVVGWQGHLALWVQRFAPWLLERLVVAASPLSQLRQRWRRRVSPVLREEILNP